MDSLEFDLECEEKMLQTFGCFFYNFIVLILDFHVFSLFHSSLECFCENITKQDKIEIQYLQAVVGNYIFHTWFTAINCHSLKATIKI